MPTILLYMEVILLAELKDMAFYFANITMVRILPQMEMEQSR